MDTNKILNEYFNFVDKVVKEENKKKKSSGFVVPLNQTDEEIPKIAFWFSLVWFVISIFILAIAGIYNQIN